MSYIELISEVKQMSFSHHSSDNTKIQASATFDVLSFEIWKHESTRHQNNGRKIHILEKSRKSRTIAAVLAKIELSRLDWMV